MVPGPDRNLAPSTAGEIVRDENGTKVGINVGVDAILACEVVGELTMGAGVKNGSVAVAVGVGED